MSDIIVTTQAGRRITLKRPNVLAQYKLVEALGDAAENRIYLGMCIPLIYVSAIDDNPVVLPVTKLEIEGLIGRLDEDGLEAVSKGIADNFQNKDAVKSAKKSQGTQDSDKS